MKQIVVRFASLFAGKENGTGSNHDAYLAFEQDLASRKYRRSSGNVVIETVEALGKLHVREHRM